MKSWSLHDARNKLSEVIQHARDAAQLITVRGREAAVVLSVGEYRRLTTPRTSLVTFLRASPLAEVEFDLDRGPDGGPDIEP